MPTNTNTNTLKPLYDFFARGSYTWTKGAIARNNQGMNCIEKDPKAVSWCLLGALHTINGDSRSEMFFELDTRVRRTGAFSIAAWNDDFTRTYGQVMELLEQNDRG